MIKTQSPRSESPHWPLLRSGLLPALVGALATPGFSASSQAQGSLQGAFTRTEQREPCANFEANRKPLFGDLHVHTSYSHDAYVSMQRNNPWDAYRYAKGEAIPQSDAEGEQTVTAQISKPQKITMIAAPPVSSRLSWATSTPIRLNLTTCTAT